MEELRAYDPAWLGRFQLLGRLGAGGMGEVYLGRASDGRLAAVKAVHPGYAGDPAFRTRFAREISTAAGLRAPWTATVLDADPDAGRPWLASEYVPGPSLERAVSETGPLPEPAVRVLAARLACALAALHAAGVVHRDLKPSNVVLAASGPWLVDFGIARAADVTQITHTGTMLGTPAFMSPEQAAGEEAGPPSDVFSLASVLAFAASGDGPFGSTGNAVALLYRVSHRDPELAGVPDGLRAELEPCLAKDPGARPAADQLSRELAHWATGPAALAWPPRAVVELTERTERESATVLTRVSTPPTVPVTQSISPSTSVPPTLAVTTPAYPRLPSPHPARPGWEDRRGRSLAIVAACAAVLVLLVGVPILVRSSGPAPETPDPIAPAVNAPAPTLVASGARQLTTVPFGGDLPNSVAVSPDSARVWVANHQGLTMLDATTNAPVLRVDMPSGSQAVALSKDGRQVYGTNLSGFLYVVDAATGQAVTTVPLPRGADQIAPVAGGRVYVSSRLVNTLSVVDTEGAGSVVATIPVNQPFWIAASPDGQRVYAGTEDSVLTVDTTTNAVLATVPVGRRVRAITVAPDGGRAYVGVDETINVLDGHTGGKLGELRSSKYVDGLAVSPNGRYLYAAGFIGTPERNEVTVLDLSTGFVADHIGLSDQTGQEAVAPNGARLYVVSEMGQSLMVVDSAGHR